MSIVGPHRVKIAFPSQLASKASKLLLLLQAKQRTKSELNCLTFLLEAGESENVLHELFVDNDIDSHGADPFYRTFTLCCASLARRARPESVVDPARFCDARRRFRTT